MIEESSDDLILTKTYSDVIRLSICSLGICCCYWFYGYLQETLLTKTNLGATFMLVLQTIANVIVALIWKQLFIVTSTKGSKEKEGTFCSNKNNKNDNSAAYKKKNLRRYTPPSSSTILSFNNHELNHPLLGLIASAYVFAMVASNESLQYVSYPTAVLAKSCKLIPTMIMGTIVEKLSYTKQQWISSILISSGIALFNLSRIQQQQKEGDKSNASSNQQQEDDVDQYWKGMGLLFISLCMDGFLGSFQGILKKSSSSNSNNNDGRFHINNQLRNKERSVSDDDDKIAKRQRQQQEYQKGRRRPPTAVETMLYVNLYALVLLIPMAIISGQWNQGIELLLNVGGTQNDRNQQQHLLQNVLLLNGVVSIGQIFIFLTITWYSSLVCTTITTTRKFFTILFSVVYFGHTFSIYQWTSVGLVFSGLYLSIIAGSGGGGTGAEAGDGRDGVGTATSTTIISSSINKNASTKTRTTINGESDIVVTNKKKD